MCLALVGVLIVATTLLGAPIQFGIVLAAAVSFLMVLRLGFFWEELEEIEEEESEAFPALRRHQMRRISPIAVPYEK